MSVPTSIEQLIIDSVKLKPDITILAKWAMNYSLNLHKADAGLTVVYDPASKLAFMKTEWKVHQIPFTLYPFGVNVPEGQFYKAFNSDKAETVELKGQAELEEWIKKMTKDGVYYPVARLAVESRDEIETTTEMFLIELIRQRRFLKGFSCDSWLNEPHVYDGPPIV